MRLVQLRRPLLSAAAAANCTACARYPSANVSEPFSRWRLDSLSRAADGRRYASVKAQGQYRVPNKKTIAKKLGAKRTGDQYVIPGNIIYKQRGTVWHPGENTIMGRDHTIHAAVTGYVKYYRDPLRHPRRQYIGVTFNRDDKLPLPLNSPRRRRLGLLATPRAPEPALVGDLSPSGIPLVVRQQEIVEGSADATVEASTAAATSLEGLKGAARRKAERAAAVAAAAAEAIRAHDTRVLRLSGDGYSYRESNWEIGRLVGPSGTVQGAAKPLSRRKWFKIVCTKRKIGMARARRARLEPEDDDVEQGKATKQKKAAGDKGGKDKGTKAKQKKA